jgi:hypothetical protein
VGSKRVCKKIKIETGTKGNESVYETLAVDVYRRTYSRGQNKKPTRGRKKAGRRGPEGEYVIPSLSQNMNEANCLKPNDGGGGD